MENKIIVNTKLGKVQGYNKDGVNKFKGIPYAKPPVGKLRFNPPVPPEPWSEVFNATEYGPICPQPSTILTAMFVKKLKHSERDCLTLNIWVPEQNQGRLPVMFWIHGGGFTTGSGAELDGTHLARRGNVIIVSINYRLGSLGFLYIPGKTANVGLLDAIEALKWVRENIEAFGGDPNNVTLFGESAGAVAVCTLMVMPAAKGLFHRVIAESGASHPIFYSRSIRKKASDRLIEKLNIKEGDIEALREVPVETIIKLDPSNQSSEDGARFTSGVPTIGPVIDGTTLPDQPLKMIQNGYAKDIELIIGTNLEETKLYTALARKPPKIDEERMTKTITNLVKALRQDEHKGKKMIEIYQKARNEANVSIEPSEILEAFLTDFAFRIPAIQFAEAQYQNQPNTYMYLFTWKSPALGGRLGSCHALELPFVYGLLSDKKVGIFPRKTEETEIISKAMMDSWSAFAKTGNPNHGGIPEWLKYNIEKRSTILFGNDIKIVDSPFDKERAAWDGIYKIQ